MSPDAGRPRGHALAVALVVVLLLQASCGGSDPAGDDGEVDREGEVHDHPLVRKRVVERSVKEADR